MENISVRAEDLKKLIRDVEQIKAMLLAQKEKENSEVNDRGHSLTDEVELTDWAKNELEEARKRKKKISHEEIGKIFFEK